MKRIDGSAAGGTWNRVLTAGVVGYGRFGRYHAAKYRALPNVRLAYIVEVDPERRALAEAEHEGTIVTGSIAEFCQQQPDMASVVVPATRHFDVATALLEAGIHVLVEKPLAATVEEAGKLVTLAQQRKLVLQPGHLERFNYPLLLLRKVIRPPCVVEAWRTSMWDGRGQDVDVIFDLMIHDLDLLLHVIQAPVTGVQSQGLMTDTDRWDVACTELQFADGSSARLCASRAGPGTRRQWRVTDGESNIVIDGHNRTFKVEGPGNLQFSAEMSQDPLSQEICAFIESVRFGSSPRVTAREGYDALKLAHQIASETREAPEPDLVARRANAPDLTAML